MLKQSLRDELTSSMKARNELKTSVLRMLLSAVTYLEIQKGGAGYEATDEDVLTVIEKQVKQRKDSIDQFEKANRSDLAEKEKKEMEILGIYLPTPLTEEEISSLITDAITQTRATGPQDMGKVMNFLKVHTKGKADGKMVSTMVQATLRK